MPDEPCAFCAPMAEAVSYPLWFVVRDADRKPGHLLLIPRRHVLELRELDRAEQAGFFDALSVQAWPRYRVQVNGPAYQHIQHLHVHVRSG